jgi:FkbM family methyltransferase
MTKTVFEKILDTLGHRKTPLLRLHSQVRALAKRAKARLSHSQSLDFLRTLIGKGDLVFDIGANVGDHTALYLELGARVVSVEPQETCVRILEKRFGKHPAVAIVPMAVGATLGEQELLLSDIRSPISSMSRSWIAAVKSSGRFPHYDWSRSVAVPVTTLDRLISEYGEPDFCKIDVEGFEQQVLQGLSRPLASLSFEFHAEFLADAMACLELLRRLGAYRFNVTLQNRMVLVFPRWMHEDEVRSQLSMLPHATLQGDVYARLDR